MINSKKAFVFFTFVCILFASTTIYAQSSDTMDNFVYMPFVSKEEPPQDLVNGDFEAGASGWVQYSTHGWQIILSSDYFPVVPHGGDWAVWLGGDYDDVSYISQEITIPADKRYLHYWHYIASEDSCGFDVGGIAVIDSDDDVTAVDAFWLCDETNTGGWVERSVDLYAFKNQTVDLVFQVETDSSFNSNLFLDDISFKNTGRSGTSESFLPPANSQKPELDGEILPEQLDKSFWIGL